MDRRTYLPLTIAALVAATAGIAQPPAAAPPVPPAILAPPAASAPPPPAPVPATVHVVLQTEQGPIVLALEKERAPITTANFLRYLDQKRLDGIAFYRATKVGQGYGLVQFGVRNQPRKVLPPIAHEPTSRTGLTHKDGTISMARGAPGTASGDFFIVVGDLTSLDANPAGTGDNQGFAAFGHVVEGMDIVRRILDAPTSPTLGEGVMKGQMLEPQIRIATARRTP